MITPRKNLVRDWRKRLVFMGFNFNSMNCGLSNIIVWFCEQKCEKILNSTEKNSQKLSKKISNCLAIPLSFGCHLFLLRIINAAMTPGTQPQSVGRNTMSIEPQPWSNIAKGGKIMDRRTRGKDMTVFSFLDSKVSIILQIYLYRAWRKISCCDSGPWTLQGSCRCIWVWQCRLRPCMKPHRFVLRHRLLSQDPEEADV